MIWKTHFTKSEADAFAQTGWYIGKSPQEILEFQLFEERLCMPFDLFHEVLEETLQRPVIINELTRDGWGLLQEEFMART